LQCLFKQGIRPWDKNPYNKIIVAVILANKKPQQLNVAAESLRNALPCVFILNRLKLGGASAAPPQNIHLSKIYCNGL